MQVNMHVAKSQLSMLGELAWKGEKVVIARAGEPYLDLVPHQKSECKLGLLKGKIQVAPDFNETPLDLIEAFEGR